MFVTSEFNIVKKAGLLAFLLALSMSLQAGTQDTDTVAKEVTDETSASEGKYRFSFPEWPEDRPPFPERRPRLNNETFASEGQRRTFSFPRWPEDRPPFPERRPRLNNETFASEGEQRTLGFPEWPEDRPPFPERSPRLNDEVSAGEDQQRTFSFPQWSKSRQINRERIPLAPPGPYMSSALSDYSVRGSSFDRASDRVGSRHAMGTSSDASMEKFSPDVPWPSHATSPARWRPDNGYRYVESHVEKKSYQLMPYNSPSNYNYGYKRRPVMNWPDGESRRNPVMNDYPAH